MVEFDATGWLKRVSGQTPAAVARQIGMSVSTLDSQLKSARGLSPHVVVSIARAYDYEPLTALVELGLITAREAGADVDLRHVAHHRCLRASTPDELVAEIARRLHLTAPPDDEASA